ncbi:MAG TPA: hypothetical protein VJ304_00055, partial [Flavobacterium sp.]|nr:hypothetical protein [Flavobacterium sp.]
LIVSFYIYQIYYKYGLMNTNKKKEPVKSLEELLDEAKTKKSALLKIIQKITKANSKNQPPD